MRARLIDRFKQVQDDAARNVLCLADQEFGKAFEKHAWKDCRAVLEATPGLLEVLEPWRRVWYAVAEMSLQEVQGAVARGLIEAKVEPGTNSDFMCGAARWGRLDVMQWLWSERQSWGYGIPGLSHALHEACMHGQLKTVQWLLDLGVPAGAAAKFRGGADGFQFGELPLFAACHNGSRAVIELLLERGADPNAVDRTTGYPPIVMAAKHGRQAVEPLLRAGADLEARLNDPEIDFGVLSMSFGDYIEGGSENFEYLLSVGVDPLKHGDALLCAASRGQYGIAKRMLDLGVDVNHQGFREHESALMLASKSEANLQTVELLLERGADPNLVDKKGRTALVSAANGPHMEVVDLLIAAGATPECVQGPRSFWQHISKQPPEVKRHIRAKVLAQTVEDAMKGPAEAVCSKPGSGGPGPL